MKTLILGGVRSGKSALAESLARESDLTVVYVATATAADPEMYRRIEEHRRRRPSHWPCVEEPLHLAAALQTHARLRRCLLVDCLTLWLTNLLLADSGDLLERECGSLVQCLPALPGEVILVSNETGLGIVPLGEINRRFCDQAGRLHQRLAQTCERVILTVAGLPQVLKGEPL
ncbi:MAG: bifunctional adenosylcobinamide kinase/adenosylcobinamide-phosphate guanylyltransferase [Gammaproteobacteria bacterium]